MKKYRRITYTDRLVIEKLYKSGCSLRAIASRTGFSVSSIHYEIKRGQCTQLDGDTWEYYSTYSATIADDDAAYQATAKGSMLKLGSRHEYANMISTRIRSGESPDQIVGDLRRSHSWTVSTTTLYRYIDQGFIPGVSNKNLSVKSTRPKRSYQRPRAARAPVGRSIEQRPKTISARIAPGHWEMDTVVGKAKGKGQALLVLTERLTRYEIIVKLPDKTAGSVSRALSTLSAKFHPSTFQTITVDNGSEFTAYADLRKVAGEVYYCHPYCSSERGSNENANRLVRRFFPKGQSLAHVTQRDCDAAAYYINNMYRKILGYATAAELFNAWQESLAKNIL